MSTDVGTAATDLPPRPRLTSRLTLRRNVTGLYVERFCGRWLGLPRSPSVTLPIGTSAALVDRDDSSHKVPPPEKKTDPAPLPQEHDVLRLETGRFVRVQTSLLRKALR